MRVLVLAIVLIAAAAATAPADEYTPVEQSSCWECHGTGLWDPVMEGPRFVEGRFIEADGGWDLEVDIANGWGHDVVHMMAIITGDVAGIGHRSGASSAWSEAGRIDADFGGGMASQEFTIADNMQYAEVTVEVASLTPQQYRWGVHPSEAHPDDWQHLVAGDLATITAPDIAAAGTRSWTAWIDADPSPNVDIDYSFEFTADNRTDHGFLSDVAAAGPNGTMTLRWSLGQAGESGSTEITITGYSHVFYDHEPPTTDNDAWLLTTQAVRVASDSGTPYFIQPAEVEEDEDQFAPGAGIVGLLATLAVALLARRR